MMELFLRKEIIKKGWLKPIVVLTALGISALYELFEWLTAIIQKESAESFLGTQGYIWDTQSDMFYCLIGSIAAILLSKIQEKFIKNENLL
jgi:putative membrane protein